MFRMSWLSARLAAALFAVPVAACSGGQTTAPEPPSGPGIKSQWQWCATSAAAWAHVAPDTTKQDKDKDKPAKPTTAPQSKVAKKPARAECPDEIRRDFEAWELNKDRSELHKKQRSALVCCYDRGAKLAEPPPPDAGPPDARPYIYRRPIKGRPLIIGDAATHAGAVAGDAWMAMELAEATPGAELSAELRELIGERWLDAALAEHASVASFARCALELLAVGAPPSLIAAAQRASLDEIEHARLCFGVASSYLGRPVSAGALPAAAPRDLDLAGLAVATFEEGCVNETIAALEAAALVADARAPRTRAVLEQIRDDEARHAELAWATVGWAVRSGGAGVLNALMQAARVGRPQADDGASERELTGALLREHGVMPARDHARLTAQAWRDTITPLLERLAAALPNATLRQSHTADHV